MQSELTFPADGLKSSGKEEKTLPHLDYLKILDAVEWIFSGDDDLDGVPNWRDELDGTNDSVDKLYFPDGTIIAEVGENIWAAFDRDGNQQGDFLRRTLTGMTTGSESTAVGATVPGGIGITVTYSGPEGTYTFQPTTYGEPEILVGGNY